LDLKREREVSIWTRFFMWNMHLRVNVILLPNFYKRLLAQPETT